MDRDVPLPGPQDEGIGEEQTTHWVHGRTDAMAACTRAAARDGASGG